MYPAGLRKGAKNTPTVDPAGMRVDPGVCIDGLGCKSQNFLTQATSCRPDTVRSAGGLVAT